MYLTYADYQSMGGTLDETAFNDFEFESECVINWYTFDRLKSEETLPEAVQRCVFALIKVAKIKADAMVLGLGVTASGGSSTSSAVSPAIASQSNDGVSISFNTISAKDVFGSLCAYQRGSEIENICRTYLQGVVNSLGHRVLYRGLYPNE